MLQIRGESILLMAIQYDNMNLLELVFLVKGTSETTMMFLSKFA